MSFYTQDFYSVPFFEIEQQSGDRTFHPLHSDYGHDNKSQTPLTQKKSNINTSTLRYEEDKSFLGKLDNSQTYLTGGKPNEKQPIVIKTYKSLLPEMLKRKKKNDFQITGTELTVYYFATNKCIVFKRNQLNKKIVLDGRNDSGNRKPPTIQHLIPILVKQYCIQFLNFDPLEVNHENFQLKIANFSNQDDPLVDPFSHSDEIQWLFDCSALILIRKQKSYQRLKVWQKKIATDMEVIQIIIPSKKQIIQQVEKVRPLSSLKQKITSNNQLGNNIVVVAYHNFTVCDFKKKIVDIVALDRILEVYRLEVSTFQDSDLAQQKEKPEISTLKQEPSLTKKESASIINMDFVVNQNLYSGKLYIQILNEKIIQKYEGGIVSYILANQRRVQRSIHTLVGISCQKTTIKMKFLTKEGAQICIYNFESKNQVESFFKCILKIGRELKQNFQKIEK